VLVFFGRHDLTDDFCEKHACFSLDERHAIMNGAP